MKHVVLVGMMGVGKTTIGRLVAQRLHRPFVDIDALIEATEGQPISSIFATKGEPYFRQREMETIRKVMNDPASVVSIGGGAYVNPVIRYLLKDPAVTFYLQANVETLLQRVGDGSTRPLLTQNGGNPAERLRTILQEREPVYILANYLIETDSLTPDQAAEMIAGYRSILE